MSTFGSPIDPAMVGQTLAPGVTVGPDGAIIPPMLPAMATAPPGPEDPPHPNLVFMPGFPHKKVRARWEARVRYCRAMYKQNLADYVESLKWLAGGDEEHPGSDVAREAKFASQIWNADFLKLVSFYNNRTPRTTCRPAKGPAMRATAEATAMLSDRSAFEMDEKTQDTLAISEAICRNHGYVFCGWDHYRWLPKFTHVRGEVWLDPDCAGDIKAARYVIIADELPLADVLADESIPATIRAKLRDRKETRRRSRVMREGVMTEAEVEKDYATPQDWDDQPDMDKVACYKIFTRDGILPGESSVDEREPAEDSPADSTLPAAGPGEAFEHIQRVDAEPGYRERTSPHMVLRAPAEVLDDAEPATPLRDPMDYGRRAYILMVDGFDQILKVTDWPMSHFDRDEFPIVECRPTRVPNLLHGTSIFRHIRPYLKIINDAIAFWIYSERCGAKRIVEIPKGMDASEKEKLGSTNMYEVVETDEPGRMRVVEFSGRMTSYKDLIPALIQLHDDTTGINDALSGKAAKVEETASANRLRMDQAVAALSYLEEAVEKYHETKARYRVAALQRYVPAVTVYAGCEECGGAGIVEGSPCPSCQGTGVDRGRPEKKGADFWLPPEKAQAWRDDLTLEEIRAEVIVGVEPGSSRQDHAERRLAMLATLADRYLPMFLQQGLFENARALMREHILASELPMAEEFVPTVEQLQAVAQQMAAQAAEQGGATSRGGGKSPEELQLAAAQQGFEQQMADRKQRLAEGMAAAELELRSQQLQIQAQQARAALLQAQAQVDGVRQRAEAEAAKAGQVDPVRWAEFELESEVEAERLAMEREKHDAEMRRPSWAVQRPGEGTGSAPSAGGGYERDGGVSRREERDRGEGGEEEGMGRRGAVIFQEGAFRIEPKFEPKFLIRGGEAKELEEEQAPPPPPPVIRAEVVIPNGAITFAPTIQPAPIPPAPPAPPAPQVYVSPRVEVVAKIDRGEGYEVKRDENGEIEAVVPK